MNSADPQLSALKIETWEPLIDSSWRALLYPPVCPSRSSGRRAIHFLEQSYEGEGRNNPNLFGEVHLVIAIDFRIVSRQL